MITIWETDLQFFNNSLGFWLAVTDALEKAQVDQHVDQGIEIGNRRTVADMGTLNAKRFGLAVDALNGGALLVDILVGLAVAIQGVAKSSADAGGHHGGAALLGPVLVVSGAGISGLLGKAQRTDKLATLMFNEADGGVLVGEMERHGQPGLAQRQSFRAERGNL